MNTRFVAAATVTAVAALLAPGCGGSEPAAGFCDSVDAWLTSVDDMGAALDEAQSSDYPTDDQVEAMNSAGGQSEELWDQVVADSGLDDPEPTELDDLREERC